MPPFLQFYYLCHIIHVDSYKRGGEWFINLYFELDRNLQELNNPANWY